MTTIELLQKIETRLRTGENDRDYLANQLMVFAAIIANGKDSEDGLVRASMGGMQYCLNRLRAIWRDPSLPEPKSLPELEEIYASVELQRFARTEKEVEETRAHYRKENILLDVYVLKIEGEDDPVYVFSSRLDQTTIDGHKIFKGEILDSVAAPVPSFQVILREITNPTKRKR